MVAQADDDEDEQAEDASSADVADEAPVSALKAARKTDLRMDALKQKSFINKPKTLREILDGDYKSKLSRDTGLGSGHGLGEGSALKSDRFDPLKAAANKTAQHVGNEAEKEAGDYSDHLDKLNEVYGQYRGVDESAKQKKSLNR
ncbi:MAG: hypothetical protein V1875_00605 [Candidatus Altiarchaeota archaeon]